MDSSISQADQSMQPIKPTKSWSQVIQLNQGLQNVQKYATGNADKSASTLMTRSMSVDDLLFSQQNPFVTIKRGKFGKHGKDGKIHKQSSSASNSPLNSPSNHPSISEEANQSEQFPELSNSLSKMKCHSDLAKITSCAKDDEDLKIPDVVPTKEHITTVDESYADSIEIDDFQIVMSNKKSKRLVQTAKTTKTTKTSKPIGNSNQNTSKFLSFLLRHGASDLGIQMDRSGKVKVDDVLALPEMKEITFEMLKNIVDTNDKQRFSMENVINVRNIGGKQITSNVWMIWANQGHSIQISDNILEEIKAPLPKCVHGTTRNAWKMIEKSGLSIMGRQYIHCAIAEPENDSVISGMRTTSKVLIYIDMAKAMADGIKFFMSANKVILTSGINGVLDTKYFHHVDHR